MRSVLVLEDEPSLLKAITLYLDHSGYLVTPAVSAPLAIQQFGHHGEIDLLIADLTMTGSSGIEVATQLRQNHPGLKAVIMSGYPIEIWDQNDTNLFAQLPADSVRVLQKPFSPMGLLSAVEDMIGPGGHLAEATGRPHPV